MICVFDLDGTLIDSSERHWRLMEHLLQEQGFIPGQDFAAEYLNFKAGGHSGMKYLTDIVGMEDNTAAGIQQAWVEHIEDDTWLAYDTLYADSLETLHRIKHPVLFLTVRENDEGLRHELRQLGLDPYPLIVLKHGQSKAQQLINLPDDCIMIGDTEDDFNAAEEAGCRSYILNRGFRNRDFWEKRGVISHDSLNELSI